VTPDNQTIQATHSIRRLAASGILSFGIKIFGAVISFAMIVVFARLLSAEEYGRFASGLNASIIVANLAMLGLQTGILRYWPKYLVEGDKARARGVVWLGYLVISGAGLLLLILSVILAVVLQRQGFGADIQLYTIVALLGLFIAIADFSTNLLRAQGSTVVSMLPRDIIWRTATPALAFVFLRSGFSLSADFSLLISAAVLVILNFWQFRVILKNMTAQASHPSFHMDFGDIRKSLIPIWISAILIAMIQQFDVVIVGTVLSKSEAGSYFAAQKTAQLLSLVLIAGGLATAPAMSALFHAGKRNELQALCRKLAIAIAAATIAGYIVLLLIGKFLLNLFDESFVSAYPILLVVGIGAVIDALAGPNAYLMQMTRFEMPYLKIMAGCYVVVVCAQLLLIPIWGSLGAAIASTAGVVLWNVIAIFILRRHAGLDPSILSLIWPPKPVAQN
jgi:O-antigen/teichoic acid export membrane protein